MMEGYNKTTYGAEWAAEYDQFHAEAPSAMIELLAELGQGGRVLELGIGTGRIALPLIARGVDITGIDISDEMVAGLRTKPGGDRIPVIMGDFADVAVDGTFRLVYLVFNTFFGLLDQDEQVRCFANVAAHLEPEGRFVIEAFVPDVARFDRDQRISTNSIRLDRVAFEVAKHYPEQQRIDIQVVQISETGISLLPVAIRYAWPSEIDLMARLAGLTLETRLGGWDRQEFGGDSVSHISIYAKT